MAARLNSSPVFMLSTVWTEDQSRGDQDSPRTVRSGNRASCAGDGLIRQKGIAIGRDAGLALSGLEVPVMTVRHPSYGGQAEFIADERCQEWPGGIAFEAAVTAIG
jgi:hypothetical protein